jgi:putative membrane protein
MKRIIALVLVSAPLAALAASDPDSAFYKNVAEAGIAEVDAGNLAAQKGTNQEVKDFGAMMVKDHSAANEKLKSLAASKNIDLPTSASVGEMAEKAKLDVLSGDTFDKSYIKGQLADHRAVIKMFRKEIASGQDAEAKAFAQATLPTLRKHLQAAEKAASDLGIDATVASTK